MGKRFLGPRLPVFVDVSSSLPLMLRSDLDVLLSSVVTVEES
jgi:hypothetical protein